MQKARRKGYQLKFEYSILLSRGIIDEKFKFLLFEDPQILGRLYKSPRHPPFHNVM